MQTESVIVKSIKKFIRLDQACALLDSKQASDAHYHARAVAKLVQGYEKGGVCGAGPLTAQHLVHVAVLCGCLPPEFISHAAIRSTTHSHTYLKRLDGLVLPLNHH